MAGACLRTSPSTLARSEKVKFIVRRREQVGNPGESFLLLAVLEYLMRAEPELLITDQGYTQSDGTSEACFYIKHPLANRPGPEREAAEPRTADPHELAAPFPADQPHGGDHEGDLPLPEGDRGDPEGHAGHEDHEGEGAGHEGHEDDPDRPDVGTRGVGVVGVELGGGGRTILPLPQA